MSLKVQDLILVSVQGINGPGAISVPGVRVGDVVLITTYSGNIILGGSSFLEAAVTVDDQIQQGSYNFSGTTFGIYLSRSIVVS